MILLYKEKSSKWVSYILFSKRKDILKEIYNLYGYFISNITTKRARSKY